MNFLRKVAILANDDMEFESDFEIEAYGDLPGIKHYHVPYKTKVKIKYSVDIQAKSWGIQSIFVNVPDQEIKFSVEDTSGKEEEDRPLKEVSFSIKNAKTVLEMGDASDKSHLSIMPNEVDIHNGKVEVKFHL